MLKVSIVIWPGANRDMAEVAGWPLNGTKWKSSQGL